MDKVLIDLRGENKLVRETLNNADTITIEELLDNFYDLLDENEALKEKIHDLENDIEENYELKNNDPYDYYGVSRNDF